MAETENKWLFRKSEAIEESLFNNTLERFYNLGISGLVRENIQNSLDGKLMGCGAPVTVKIRTGVLKESDIPGIEEVKKHIAVLKGENRYTEETITHMKSCLRMKEVPYISFEDCNTKGLKGAEHGENIQEGDTWGIYAYKKGVHHTETDENWENTRGGSHGVGKIASNAASDLHLMYFANCDERGKQYIGGTAELIEHELDGVKFRATGYFTREKDSTYYPFENDFNPVFDKKTRGLKIIVPYLREQFNDVNEIIRAVCDNFFVAVIQEKLCVYVNDVRIEKESIHRIVQDKSVYIEQEICDIKKNFTPLYIRTYTEKEPLHISVKDKSREYLFKLYFCFDKKIKKGRVAVVRGIGMKIEDKKITGHANTSFNGVLIPEEPAGDVFLKSLENESHTSLSYEHIRDPQLQKNARKFINNIGNEIKKIIIESIENENPADGQIDTSDLIYSVERTFKKNLSRYMPSVEINKDGSKGKTTAVKIRNIKKKTSDTGKRKSSKSKKPVIRTGKGADRNSYLINAEAVNRLLVDSSEILLFNFSADEQYEGENKCDISLAVIDGAGQKDNEKFDLSMNYAEIRDKTGNNICAVEGNTIKDVSIINGKVHLEMKTKEGFNEACKFIYYVEV